MVTACGHPKGVITIMAADPEVRTQIWGCKQLMKIGFNGVPARDATSSG